MDTSGVMREAHGGRSGWALMALLVVYGVCGAETLTSSAEPGLGQAPGEPQVSSAPAPALDEAVAPAASIMGPMVAPEPTLAARATWRDLPGLRLLSQARFRAGGVVIAEPGGTQYFLKPKGLHGLRIGVNVPF